MAWLFAKPGAKKKIRVDISGKKVHHPGTKGTLLLSGCGRVYKVLIET